MYKIMHLHTENDYVYIYLMHVCTCWMRIVVAFIAVTVAADDVIDVF